MDTGLLLVAAFCGIWQFVSTTDFGYTLSDTLGQPVLVGALLGIITGQIEQGLLIGGSLELMYLGIIYPGGTAFTHIASLLAGKQNTVSAEMTSLDDAGGRAQVVGSRCECYLNFVTLRT